MFPPIGRKGEIRTPSFCSPSAAVCQLTYFPIIYPLLSFKSRIVLVLRGGFEPTYLPLIRRMHVPYVLAQMVQRRRIELPLRDYRSRLLTIVGPLYILVVRFRVELKSTVFQTARLTTLRTLP